MNDTLQGLLGLLDSLAKLPTTGAASAAATPSGTSDGTQDAADLGAAGGMPATEAAAKSAAGATFDAAPAPASETGALPDLRTSGQAVAAEGAEVVLKAIAGSALRVVQPDGPDGPDGLDGLIYGDRVTRLAFGGGEVTSVRILEHPAAGTLSVNPDNTLALSLTGADAARKVSFVLEIERADGRRETLTETLDLAKSPQKAGWGIGDHYMLQTDAGGDLILETGDVHRKVYISNAPDALSLADIAAREGLGVDDLTGKKFKWFRENGQDYDWGGSAATALDPEAGMALWYATTGKSSGANSNWLLIERGHEYEGLGRLIAKGANGESALHPTVITAWGAGAAPVIHDVVNAYQDRSDHIVITDLALAGGIKHHGGENLILDGIEFDGRPVNVQNVDGFTFRNSDVIDVFHDSPQNKGGIWKASANRLTGLFNKNSDGVLIENSFFDHNGWDDGYDPGLSARKPQPPSFYSHNVYIQYDSTDVTFRDNVSMRAASFGAQIRPGGFIEDNVFLDNNAALNFLGGNYKAYGNVGNYSLVTDNLVTSGAHKRVDGWEGAVTMGIDDGGELSAMIDNIVAHLSNPDDLAEFREKVLTHFSLKHQGTPLTDDTIVFNWVGSKHAAQFDERSINVDGLDQDILNRTTIQRFAAALLQDGGATIADLAAYWRSRDGAALEGPVDADAIIAYFQNGFGIAPGRSPAPGETLRFVPDLRGEGMRWDNRLNWTDGEGPVGALPADGDSVDLGGNRVNYGGTTVIEDLELGLHGSLRVGSGYLGVAGAVTAAERGHLAVDRAGQLWIDGLEADEMVFVEVRGGRFANTGLVRDADGLSVSGHGQAILATGGAGFELGADAILEISGGAARAGFDGDGGGRASLRLDDGALLRFVSDREALGSLGEFRSGRFGDAPDVASFIDLGGADLEIDLSARRSGGSELLVAVDDLVGRFGEVEIAGLSGKLDAELIIDYGTDTIELDLERGRGRVEVTYVDDGAATGALTAYHDDPFV